MRAKMFNPQIFLESLCCFIFGGLIFYLVISGEYLSYVTPRMGPYLYFTVIVMGIWAFMGLFRLYRPQHRIRSGHCFVLVIPILLLLLPHSPLSTADLSGNYFGGNIFSGLSGQSSYGASQNPVPSESPDVGAAADSPTETPAASDSASPTASPAVIENTPPSETAPVSAAPSDTPSQNAASPGLSGLDVANKTITVSNDDFGMWLSEIFANMDKYEGYTVIMTGYVYKDPSFMKSDEFAPVRLMMSCCVADLAPAGLICKYDKASELKDDAWVTVEGTLFIGQYEYDGQVYKDPELTVTKITPAKKVEGYVYPY